MKPASAFIRGANAPAEPAATGPRAGDVADILPAPWDSIDPRVKAPMVLRMDARLDDMLRFIADNTPRTSKHSFALEAVRAAAEQKATELLRKNRG